MYGLLAGPYGLFDRQAVGSNSVPPGRITDEDVERPELTDRLLDQKMAIVLAPEIPWQRDGAPPGFADPSRGLLGLLVVCLVTDEQVHAFTSECDRDSASNS